MSSGVTLEGMLEINNALEQFEHKLRKKIMKQAAGKVAAEMRKDLRRSAPKGLTGNLKKSASSGSKVLRKKNTIWGGAWFSTKGNKKGSHAPLIEYGTDERFVQNYRGHEGVEVSVGKITGKPIAKPVFKRHKGKQIKTFERFIGAAIKKVKSVN